MPPPSVILVHDYPATQYTEVLPLWICLLFSHFGEGQPTWVQKTFAAQNTSVRYAL
jgi:hypothetical protein